MSIPENCFIYLIEYADLIGVKKWGKDPIHVNKKDALWFHLSSSASASPCHPLAQNEACV